MGRWTYEEVWPEYVTLPDVTEPIVRLFPDMLDDVRYHREADDRVHEQRANKLEPIDSSERRSPRVQHEMVQVWVSKREKEKP